MMQADAFEAVVAGHTCLDIFPPFRDTEKKSPADLFVPGKLITMGKATLATGGPISNTGIALSLLGIPTKLMGKIGDDRFGETLLALFRERDFHNGMIVVKGEETSYTIAITPPGCDRIFLHNPGANGTFCADDIDYDTVAKARLFHFGYPPLMKKIYENDGRELVRIFQRVKDLGLTTSLDMSLPDASSDAGRVDWAKVLKNLLPYVDIYLPSVEETMFMIQRDSFRKLNENKKGRDILETLDLNMLPSLGNELISCGAKIVVLKCGLKGFYIRTQGKDRLTAMGKTAPGDPDNWANREIHEESFYVRDIVSATGSGDNSIAGFLAAYLNGKTVEQCIRVACTVGAQNVRVHDGLSGIKPWDVTWSMAQKGGEKNRLSVSGNYWTYDSPRNIWVGNKDKSRGKA